MPFEKFIERRFSEASLGIIEQANAIIQDYREQGFTLTLRQLYYQFVAKDLLPNKMSEYKRLGSIVNDGRLAGLIDWAAIEDRTRNVERTATWDSAEEIVGAAADSYKEDLWQGQLYRPEVWIEKDALVGVIEPVCDKFRVPRFACRGYSSQSEQWRAGKRFERVKAEGLIPIILHLGDHDPSGIDMTRDNRDRLTLFAYEDVEVRRLALNIDQVRRYRPPPNPAKETDSRSTRYTEKFGNKCWELDALDPPVIARLIENELEDLIDLSMWEPAQVREEKQRSLLKKIYGNWSVVEKTVERIKSKKR